MAQATIAPVLWGGEAVAPALWVIEAPVPPVVLGAEAAVSPVRLLARRPARPAREGPAVPTDRRAANSEDEGAPPTPIGRVKPGQREAIGERFESFRPDVMRLCTRLVGRDDAEDATQEVFLRAQTRIETFDAAQPFRRWLLAIGSNHCIDRLRRRGTERLLFTFDEPDALKSAATQPSALDGVMRGQNYKALSAALDQLPDRYRAPLVLRYFAELDYDAIADELELTRAQVGTLLFRAKRRLRVLLPMEEEAPG